jgi:glycosyltransferase involved in cell wall biosynthesis
MRILVCSWKDRAHPRAGGAEVFTHAVAKQWVGAGHDVTLCTAEVDGRPATEVVDGVRIVRRGGRYGVYRSARLFYESGQAGDVDLLIDEINTRPFGCSRWRGNAVVIGLAHQVAKEVWMHEVPLPLAIVGRYWLEPRWLRAYRDVPMLTISPSSARSLAEMGLDRVFVIPPGPGDEPMPSVRKEPRPTLIFVGRLASNKRPDHAIAAFARVREALPDAQLWVVGTGPLEATLRAQAPTGVTFFGRVSEAEKYSLLARSHLLLVTSVREGWGLVVDEAARAGARAIGYAVDGLRDSVPAAAGVLVPPRPEWLADEVLRQLPTILADPPRCGWRGGTRPWPEVADAMLSHAERFANLRAPARRS